MSLATISTKFTAVDGMSSIVKKIGKETTSLGKKANVAISKMERTGQKMNRVFSGVLGTIGKIGLAVGLSATLSTVAQNTMAVESSFASLQAITGVTGKQFESFKDQIKEVGDAQFATYSDVAKGFELIGSAKPELLGNAEALATVTDAAITLSKAADMELADSAKNMTAAMNQFGLGAEYADRTINTLAAGQKVGSSSIENTIESMKKFGTIAAGMGISLEEAVGAVQSLSEIEQGAEAGTKLRNVFSKLSAAEILPADAQRYLRRARVDTKLVTDETVSLSERLREMSKIANDSNAIMKIFGTENAAVATHVLNNIDRFDQMTKEVTNTNEAIEQAAIKGNTFAAILGDIQNEFNKAITATDTESKSMNMLKDSLKFVRDNMSSIIKVGVSLIGVFVSMKAIIITVTTVTKFLTAAKVAFAAVMKVVNLIMAVNPFILIAMAIAALIGLIVLAIAKFDSWGAVVLSLMGGFGLLVSIIRNVRKHWDDIVSAFKDGGIIAGIKKIGLVILDAILLPVQQLLELLGKIPGVDIANEGAAKISEYRSGLLGTPSTVPETSTSIQSTRDEKIESQRVTVDFLNPNENTVISSSGDDIAEISLIGTTGYYGI